MVKARTRWFAKDARTDRAVTFLFTCLSALGLALIVSYHLQGTMAIAIVDSIYIVGLFAYRYCQWKWSNFWYRRNDAQTSRIGAIAGDAVTSETAVH
jgi:lipid-A-disaccharide synthase-like uncharacterized protein